MERDIVLLPGGSKYNRRWAEDFKKILDNEFRTIYNVNYDNWNDGDDRFEIYKEDDDVEREARRSNDYGVVAYKEGCIVALKNIREGRLHPKFVVMIGFPYGWSEQMRLDDEVRSWLHSLTVPTLFIQQDKDEQIGSDELDDLVDDSVDNFRMARIYNDSDGQYDNHYDLLRSIREFLR